MVSGPSRRSAASVPRVSGRRDDETVVVLRADSFRPQDQRLAMGHIVRSAAFVALWMALGAGFRIARSHGVRMLDENAYLVVGVPLTIAWQLAVRRRSPLELWVDRWANRGKSSVARIAMGVVFALLAAIVPVRSLVKGWSEMRGEPQMIAWSLCAILGAAGVGYAVSKLHAADAKSLFGCLGTAGVVGCGQMIFFTVLRMKMMHEAAPHLGMHALRVAGTSFALYLPICFLLEEVTFRGLVDADVRDGRPIEGIAMAAFSSVLWGLWHVPIAPVHKPIEFLSVSIVYPVVHVLIGIPLALWYRRSGNLLVPALTHAFIDAIRNALLAG